MEYVLEVYKRPYNPLYPVVCMDESPMQLIGETRHPLPMRPCVEARFDYEYRRCGVCSIFIASEPLAGKRMVTVTERRTKIEWAHFLGQISDNWPAAEKITLVMEETKAWEEARNGQERKINWQFTTDDARIILKRLYPTFED
jgi:hypothetical protein